jgi:PAS domain S-box-containing protein
VCPERLDIEVGSSAEDVGEVVPIDLEFLTRDYLILVLNFDRHLYLEFSTATLGRGDEAGAPYAAGSSFEAVFGGPRLEPAAALARGALEGDGGQLELQLAAPGGPISLRLRFMPRRAAGRPPGFVVVVENVTARRAELVRLTALEDRLSAILNNIADGVVVIDAAGRIEGLNQAAARIAGRNVEDLKGQRVSELMAEPYRSAHQSHIQRYLETGESGILNVGPRRLPMQRGDGGSTPIELSVGEALIGGERKFIGLFRDLTESLRQEEALVDANAELKARIAALESASHDLEAQKLDLERLAAITQKARDAAEQANRAKSRFVATVSHELRTPLNGILAVSDMLARRNLSDDAREMAELIQRSGRSLLALLNDILDMAKVEAGLLQVRVRPFRPADVLDGVGEMWRLAAEARSVRLALSSENLPEAVLGDPDRLKQVLSNLINNALKFTDGRTVLVRAEAGPSAPGACAVRFTVADEGPGIPTALREKIFEPFIQAESGDSRRHAGSGLGLTICRELVTLMGGRIWAEGHGERGTAMVAEIEFALADRAAPAADGPHPDGAPPLPADLYILVAEDHPANRQVMGLILEEAGWRFDFAQDGRQALDKAAGGGFDVILMDQQMPHMDGLTATRAIRALGGAAGAVPIVGVTASASPEDVARALDAGMDDVVTKPIDPARMIQVVARCVNGAGRNPAIERGGHG